MKVSLKNAIIAISFLPLLVYAIIYGYFGETIPIAWNEFGEITGYVTKTMAVFIIPLTVLFVSVVLYYIKKISHKRKIPLIGLNYNLFWLFIVILMAFAAMFPLYLITFDGGNTYDVLAMSLLVIAGLVLIAGFIFPTFKFEGKYGFITPWTKASENVFYRTQQIAASTFVIGSLFLAGLTLFVSDHEVLVLAIYILLLAVMMLIPLLYSKNSYENEE